MEHDGRSDQRHLSTKEGKVVGRLNGAAASRASGGHKRCQVGRHLCSGIPRHRSGNHRHNHRRPCLCRHRLVHVLQRSQQRRVRRQL